MTTAAAQQFLERMRSDWDFYFRIALADGPDQRMALVRADGFDCTPEEVRNACEQLSEGPGAGAARVQGEGLGDRPAQPASPIPEAATRARVLAGETPFVIRPSESWPLQAP